MTRNICLVIEYDGTRFSGWQKQSRDRKSRTIQEEIEQSGKKLFGKKIRLIGAGRTDTGVHAEAQVANFKVSSRLPLSNIKKGLNSYLPKDIAILSAEDASLDFHSRFNAKGKLYRYTILNQDTRSPLIDRYSSRVVYDLDINLMKSSARCFVGKKDFKSHQASDKKNRTSIRTIKRLDIVVNPPMIDIYVQADGFLYNMVRNIVGTLIEVGRGKISTKEVKKIIAKKDRRLAGPTAPAKGLCLVKVIY
ncbi:MAG: tRNA pseudouridine(38-40) synthase TruA [Candidatus Omnitrophota bacterium]|nr:tRNA pseudouridine(38-40) synthase TruA [Candidatus Omnitrophota bacterium]